MYRYDVKNEAVLFIVMAEIKKVNDRLSPDNLVCNGQDNLIYNDQSSKELIEILRVNANSCSASNESLTAMFGSDGLYFIREALHGWYCQGAIDIVNQIEPKMQFTALEIN